MKISNVLVTCIFVVTASVSPCYAESPSEDFFEAPFSQGGVRLTDDATKIFRLFNDLSAEWKKENDNQWVATTTDTDPRTNAKKETSFYFSKFTTPDGKESRVLLDRVLVNGADLSRQEVSDYASVITMMANK